MMCLNFSLNTKINLLKITLAYKSHCIKLWLSLFFYCRSKMIHRSKITLRAKITLCEKSVLVQNQTFV